MKTPFTIRFIVALSLVALPALGSSSFSIQEREGTSCLIRPDGEPFFSLGVCMVDEGIYPSNLSPTNHSYAALRHYANSNQWAAATLKRLKSWGFTTIGGWSDFRTLRQPPEAEVAFTPVLHVGSTCGVPWWDMWDTAIIARMHDVARRQILPLREDMRLLGYYSDNEMGWWNAALFKMTLEHPPTSGQRQRLIQLLRSTYHDEWKELLLDFEPENAASFIELDQRGLLYLRPGGNGIRTCRTFLRLMAERYYALVHEVIRTYDQRGLILGDRYQSFYYPDVVRACAQKVDAISSNLNAAWNDGSFPRFYLETLHALSSKPVLVSEFYMAAQQNRSGNKNDRGTFPTVATQRERVAGFRATLEALAQTPFVVGADWFQYYDEPSEGRYDGENFNFGLVDIHNRPYAPVTAAASALDLAKLHSKKPPKRLDASAGVPPAPGNPFDQFKVMLALKHWDRERGFIKPVSEFPLADLYVCWDKEAVYLGLYAQNVVEEAYYRNGVIPESDWSEWSVVGGQSNKTVRIRFGPRVTLCSDPSVRVMSVSGSYLNTRNISAVQLPAKLFGRKRLNAGDSIELASTFFTQARADRVDWNGTFVLSSRR